jgi:hypothetical protein
MKLASLTAAIAVALVMAAAMSSPAAACKRAGYHGYRTADAGAVVGYRHGKHWKHGRHWKHRMIK